MSRNYNSLDSVRSGVGFYSFTSNSVPLNTDIKMLQDSLVLANVSISELERKLDTLEKQLKELKGEEHKQCYPPVFLLVQNVGVLAGIPVDCRKRSGVLTKYRLNNT